MLRVAGNGQNLTVMWHVMADAGGALCTQKSFGEKTRNCWRRMTSKCLKY